MTGTGLLMPLSPENGYQAEVMLCGGSTIDDSRPGYEISAKEPASAQCSRLLLTPEGIKRGWAVESMPQARVMPDAVLLPTGQVVVVNGAGSGIAGYSNVKDRIGQSNAANPVLQPVLYDPSAPLGKRFSTTGMPVSNIPRLYHSVASLTPNGSIMIAGSNPNLDRSNEEYGTEYRVEWLEPPYLRSPHRPLVNWSKFFSSSQKTAELWKMKYNTTFELELEGVSAEMLRNAKDVKVSLMDLGFVTHSLHMNSRLVYLVCRPSFSSSASTSLIIQAPPHASIYPPGPAFLFIVIDGVPSVGQKVMVGNGEGPPADESVRRAMLKESEVVKGSATKISENPGGE